MLSKKIELLAPARNFECGIAAINHGADAVYIGGPQFGARAAAANSLADIEHLVAHAHQFRARVYVALNTIFDDRELLLAVRLCQQLYDIGIDALIIQDVGLLESELPPIPLHSSTQMNNRTVDKVRFLEKVGFQQVVLARELSLAQIKEIHAATGVVLEFFVHGALCVSYSGQCYISEVVAGRSANRGECAQFCRHKYSLRDGRGKIVEKSDYLLSLKDLNLSSHLAALIDAGVTSFKIEGRLKDDNYVKNVTAYYRQRLDKIIEADSGLGRSSSGACSFGFTPDPAKSFHRGSTDYFLTNPRNTPGAIQSSKSTGQQLGRVVRADKRSFTLERGETVINGDGLCFFDPQKGLVGIKANRVEDGVIYPKDPVNMPVGTVVYRNSDTAFNKILAQSKLCRTLQIRFELKESDEGLLMLAVDEDGIVTETAIRVEKTEARQVGTVAALAEKQLRKLGGTVFSLDDVRVELNPRLFYPAAVFNELRRKGIANHLETRLREYQVERVGLQVNDFPWPEVELSYLDNIGNSKAEAFYRRHGVTRIDRKSLRASDVDDCALMTTRYCVKAQLGICPKMDKKADALVEPLSLFDNSGEYELGFHCEKCEMMVKKRKAPK